MESGEVHPGAVESSVSSREFDLSGVAIATFGYQRSRRWLALGLSAFLFAFAAFGGYLAITIPKTSLVSWVGPFLIIGIGLGLGAMGIWASPKMGPVKLIVDDHELRLEGRLARPQERVRWDDPHLKLTLADLRGLPKVWSNGVVRPTDFTLSISTSPEVSVTEAAYECILENARMQHLDLERRSDSVRWSSLQVLKLTITPNNRAKS